jgi:hypothetical protein
MNMTNTKLTKEEAIQEGYEEQVEALDGLHCEMSDDSPDDPVEFTASHRFTGADGDDHVITAYYYQDKEALDSLVVDECSPDLGTLDWVPTYYEVRKQYYPA